MISVKYTHSKTRCTNTGSKMCFSPSKLRNLKLSGVKDSVEKGVDFFFPGVGVDLEIAVAF